MNHPTTPNAPSPEELLRRHLEKTYLAAWRSLHPVRYDPDKHPLGAFFLQVLDPPALRTLLRSAIDGSCDDLLYVALEAPLRAHAPRTHVGAAHLWWKRVSWLKARILGCFLPWDPLVPPQGPVTLSEALQAPWRDDPPP